MRSKNTARTSWMPLTRLDGCQSTKVPKGGLLRSSTAIVDAISLMLACGHEGDRRKRARAMPRPDEASCLARPRGPRSASHRHGLAISYRRPAPHRIAATIPAFLSPKSQARWSAARARVPVEWRELPARTREIRDNPCCRRVSSPISLGPGACECRSLDGPVHEMAARQATCKRIELRIQTKIMNTKSEPSRGLSRFRDSLMMLDPPAQESCK